MPTYFSKTGENSLRVQVVQHNPSAPVEEYVGRHATHEAKEAFVSQVIKHAERYEVINGQLRCVRDEHGRPYPPGHGI